MDITTILNRKGSAAVVAAEAQFQQQFIPTQLGTASPRMKPEPGAPESGDSSVLPYAAHPPPLAQMTNTHQDMRYAPQQPPTSMPLMQGAYAYPTAPVPNGAAPPGRSDPPPKSFHCSTCGKGFARRSDLARHGKFDVHRVLIVYVLYRLTKSERIHSGVRPHACPWPNCGKQFIQRSALTVHHRIHTGEKPHMCERCGKVRYAIYVYQIDLTPGSLLAIRPRWLDTAESTPASGLINVPTRIARRHSLDGPP